MILRLQVNNGNTGPHSDYRIGTIAENSNYSSSVRVSEIVAFDSVLSSSDAQIVENYLKNKWGVENILDSSTFVNHGTGKPKHASAKFGDGISYDGSPTPSAISSRIEKLPVNRLLCQFGFILKVKTFISLTRMVFLPLLPLVYGTVVLY